MNRLGLGTNNFRIIGSAPPPPEFTRYIITDCVSENTYITLEYEWGTFNINDRVGFNKPGGIPTFGKINSYTTEIGDDINPSPFGVNSANCFDNVLNFTSVASAVEGGLTVSFYCNPSNENFVYNGSIDSYLIYNYNLFIYIEGEDGEGDNFSEIIQVDGQSNEIGNYNFIQGEDNFIFQVFQNISGNITFMYIDEGQEQPYFGGTQQYTDNNGCSYNYFLQNETGYTFLGIARQDNC